MTVETSTARSGPYAGAGLTGPFPVVFRFLDNSHLSVIQTSAAGVETELVLGVDFTATGAGAATGSVTTTIAVPFGDTLTVLRDVPLTQLTDYVQSDSFPAQSHEDALDKLTMIAQQQGALLIGVLRVPESSTSLPLLPPISSRALHLLGFDASGNPIAVAPVDGSAASLATDLTSASSLSKGAGQIGYSSLSYVGGTVGAALNTVFAAIATFVSLPTLAASTGANLVGWIQSGIGAVLRTTRDKMRERVTLEDFGAVGDGVTNDAPAIQLALNLGKPVYSGNPNAVYRCATKLVPKVGSYLHGSTSGVLPGSGDNTGSTVIMFDDALTSVGFEIGVTTGFMHSWGIEGFTLTTTTAANARIAFRMFNNLSIGAGYHGTYNFVLRNVSIVNAQYGIYSDNAWFAGTMDNVAFIGCYKVWLHTATDFITSMDIRWLKASWCFHGFDLNNATYNTVHAYFDNCGLSVPWIAAAPANEMPVLQKFNNCANWSGSVGGENSNAMLLWASNYSSIEIAVFGFNSVATLWQESASRVSNIAQAQQALIRVDTSFVKINNWVWSATTGSGYPAASTTVPSYFARIVTAGDAPRLILENCFLNLPSYCISPSADVSYLYAPDATNTRMIFGATNITTLHNEFGIEKARLRIGEPVVQDYHQITRNATFVSGDEVLRVIGATGASASLKIYACAGGSANAANAPVKISSDTVTSRGLAVHGTVNASGADYAEYEVKRIGCGVIAKGDICGFDAAGRLTDKWSLRVTQGIKTTNPSLVGGDVHDMEGDARLRVDRIAYAGKVPVNVMGASPGDYINAAEGPGDSIVGLAGSLGPNTVGRVIYVGLDGRAIVKVL